MKKTYHICISAGDELYCRDEEDYIRCFNSLAIAIAETDSVLLAESIMSNHIHECVRSSNAKQLIQSQRYKYARYFSAKYKRKGRLGEKTPFIIEVEGIHHTMAALSYTLRNPLHHGITATPFGYPHCSARTIFQKDLGHFERSDLMAGHNMSAHLPSRRKCPAGWKMDKSGLILRECVIDTSDIEHIYGTPRNFLYHMNRLSGEEWRREQEKDKKPAMPITIDAIENGITYQTIEQMLANEHGRNDYRRMTDMQVCHIIDKVILPEAGRESVYTLTDSEKTAIARNLYRTYRLPESQIKRCLAMAGA